MAIDELVDERWFVKFLGRKIGSNPYFSSTEVEVFINIEAKCKKTEKSLIFHINN